MDLVYVLNRSDNLQPMCRIVQLLPRIWLILALILVCNRANYWIRETPLSCDNSLTESSTPPCYSSKLNILRVKLNLNWQTGSKIQFSLKFF